MKVQNLLKTCGIVTILCLLFPGCQEPEPVQEIIRPVRYIETASTQGIYVRVFTGVAQSGTESNLSFRVPGTINEIAVQVGDRVRAGDVIAELDPYDYELQLQQMEASLLQAKARSRNADAGYERARALYEKRSASKSELDTARMSSEAANASVLALEKQQEMARMKLTYTRLIAPADGAIAEVKTEVNENVQAGAPVVLLTSGAQIEVKVSIPEVLISQIEAETEAIIRFDAVPERQFQARISEVGVRSTGLATTFPVTLILIQKDPDIRAGMAAAVELRFKLKDDRVRYLVPSESVGEDRLGRFVFVIESLAGPEGLGTVRRRPVVVGELTENGMEIFEGLADQEKVVTAGVSQLVDGQKVKLQ